MSYRVSDLHCDLLGYLVEDDQRSPMDPEPRCSIPMLKEGGVALQTLAIFTEAKPGSGAKAVKQATIFNQLEQNWGDHFKRIGSKEQLIEHSSNPDNKIGVIAAIESAAGICEENESLEDGFKRLDEIMHLASPLLYISLTWIDENRFAGGNGCEIGLKDDGRRLLDRLSGEQIAIDLSHASDALVTDTFNYIDRERLDLQLMVSHTCFRKFVQIQRNLPDEFAKEVLKRDGIIGMNFMSNYLGPEDPENLLRHIEYGFTLGAEKQLAFGADFFYMHSLPEDTVPETRGGGYCFEEYRDSSCYPHLLAKLEERDRFSKEQLEALCSQNMQRFIETLWD